MYYDAMIVGKVVPSRVDTLRSDMRVAEAEKAPGR